MIRRVIKKYWLIICILLLAIAVRGYQLGSVPGSLYWEEAALGYDAYSILKTGKDFHSNSWPIVSFTSFGDYKPSLYFYSVIPFIKLFGLTDIAVRLPSAISGVLTVLVVYLIGKKLFTEKIGVLAALVFAIQPWSMHVSRVGFETNLATLLLSLGILFLLYAKKKILFLLPSALSFSLSMYAYHSARIIAPFLAGIVFFLFVFDRKKINKRIFLTIITSITIALICISPIMVNIKNPSVMHRAAETSIFSDVKPIEESNALKMSSGNTILSRVLYHRYVIFGSKILENFTKNVSFDFLFLNGDENIRHQTKEFGVLYHWEFFTLVAFLYVLLKKKTKNMLLLVVWVIIAGIPPAITTVVPHTLRFLAAGPAFALMSAIGLQQLYDGSVALVKKKRFLQYFVTIFFVGVVCVDALLYFHYYFSHYGAVSSRDFQYGYKQLYEKIETIRRDDQKIVVTREQGRPSIYYMFYGKLDPSWVQEQEKSVKKDQGELLELGQYVFVDSISKESGVLIASSPSRVEVGARILDTIYLPDGEILWQIWER